MSSPLIPATMPSGDAGRAPAVQLDDVDWALLRELQREPRSPYNSLGEAVGLSGDAVRERLRRLERADVVQVIGVVDPEAFGFTTFALAGLRTTGPLDRVLAGLLELPEADFVVCTTGSFDVLVELTCRDDRHLLDVLANGVRSSDGVVATEVFAYLKIAKWSASVERPLLRAAAEAPDGANGNGVDISGLDDVDLQLVRLLHENGRASYKELGDAVGLPYSTARRRVQHLLDEHVVRAETIVNRVNLGVDAMAAVGVTTEGPVAPVVDALRAIDEVEIVVVTSGRFDVLLEVATATRDELVALVTGKIRSVPGVRSSETLTYLDIVRLPYAWSISGQAAS